MWLFHIFLHCVFYLDNYVFTDPENKDNKSDILIMSDLMYKVEKNEKKYKTTPMRYERKQTISNSNSKDIGFNGHCANNTRCPLSRLPGCKFGSGEAK
jgi:hypothetical protein